MDVVIGAAGHLGNALVRALRAQGRQVRALARAGTDCSCLAGEEAEVCRADLMDLDSLLHAFRGAERVFHAAGQVSFGVGGTDELYATNVEGTANVIRACGRARIARLVYVSSIEALDLTGPGRIVTEEAGFHPDRSVMEYGRTKALASRAVLDACRDGFDAVIVCPTGYLGPYDYRLSAMGRMVVDFVRRRIPLLVPGGFDFVDVRDVADGTVRAADRGKSGAWYILSGSYVTVAEIMRELEAITGIPAPSLVLPGGLALLFARIAEQWYALRGSPPRFTTGSVKTLALDIRASSDRARRELGYEPRPFRQTVEDTLAWFGEQGLLPSGGEEREATT